MSLNQWRALPHNLFTLEPPTPSNFHCPPKSRRIVVTKMAAQLPVSPEDSSFYSPFKPSPSPSFAVVDLNLVVVDLNLVVVDLNLVVVEVNLVVVEVNLVVVEVNLVVVEVNLVVVEVNLVVVDLNLALVSSSFTLISSSFALAEVTQKVF